MELKEGMYVRTNEGKITKLIEIDKDGFQRFDKCIDFTNYEIIKASCNIIDLIEIGDYVNGEYVWRETNNSLMIGDVDNGCPLNEIKIETIVTKEMFSSVEYRVEE